MTEEDARKLQEQADRGRNLRGVNARLVPGTHLGQGEAGKLNHGAPVKPTAKKRGMNSTETRYSQLLEARKQTGEILDWKFEGLSFRLAAGARFRPDFMVIMPDQTIELNEVKGFFVREAALVRLKVAAEMYPHFVWNLCKYIKGEWIIRRLNA